MVKRPVGSFGSLLGELTPWLLMPILILALSPTASAQRVWHLRVRQTASQSLTLIKPTDPNFETTLDAFFPGVSHQDGYQQSIRPFLVIVRNDNYLPAVAYAITWTARYEDGGIRRLRAIFVNRHLMLRQVMAYIPPGRMRLISPLMLNVAPQQYESNPDVAVYPAESYPPSKGLVSVDPNVDGVVYTHGSFIGPDRTYVLQRYVVARFAERDEVLSALDLLKSSGAPQFTLVQQLQEKLQKQVQLGDRVSKRTLLARYVRARDRSAQDLQRILRNRGLTGLEAMLQRYVGPSGGRTSPSMFGRMYQKLSKNDPRVFGGTPRPFLWGMSWTAAQQ